MANGIQFEFVYTQNKKSINEIQKTIKSIQNTIKNTNVKLIDDENLKKILEQQQKILANQEKIRKETVKETEDRKATNTLLKQKERLLQLYERANENGLVKTKKMLKDILNTNKLISSEKLKSITQAYTRELNYVTKLKNIQKEENSLVNKKLEEEKKITEERIKQQKIATQLLQKEKQIVQARREQPKVKKETNSEAGVAGSGVATYMFTNAIGNVAETIREIDRSAYNLGVVSGKTVYEIEAMKNAFMELSAVVPISISELMDATNIINRTGLSFLDSFKAVRASSKLASASGEDLSFTAEFLAKQLVAFGLTGEQASDTIDKIHTIALTTPTSLKGINDTLKASASAFGALISFTDKSGESLIRYKENLVDLNLAMTGTLAQMGTKASTSGIIIRNFMSRILSAEKTAAKMFNNLNINFGSATENLSGFNTNFEKLSHLAKTDVYQALDVLAGNMDVLIQTTTEGSNVMQKLFTNRQWTSILNILKEIRAKGSTEIYVSQATEGKSVEEDLKTRLRGFDAQVKQLSNNLDKIKASFAGTFKDVYSVILNIINPLAKFFNLFSDTAIGQIIKMGVALQTFNLFAGNAFALLQKISFLQNGLVSLGAIFGNPVLLATTAIASATYVISKSIDKAKELKEMRDSLKKQYEDLEKTREKETGQRLRTLETEFVAYDSIKAQIVAQNKAIREGTEGEALKLSYLDKQIAKFKEIKAINSSIDEVSLASFNIEKIQSSIKLIKENPSLRPKEERESLERIDKINDIFQNHKLKDFFGSGDSRADGLKFLNELEQSLQKSKAELKELGLIQEKADGTWVFKIKPTLENNEFIPNALAEKLISKVYKKLYDYQDKFLYNETKFLKANEEQREKGDIEKQKEIINVNMQKLNEYTQKLIMMLADKQDEAFSTYLSNTQNIKSIQEIEKVYNRIYRKGNSSEFSNIMEDISNSLGMKNADSLLNISDFLDNMPLYVALQTNINKAKEELNKLDEKGIENLTEQQKLTREYYKNIIKTHSEQLKLQKDIDSTAGQAEQKIKIITGSIISFTKTYEDAMNKVLSYGLGDNLEKSFKAVKQTLDEKISNLANGETITSLLAKKLNIEKNRLNQKDGKLHFSNTEEKALYEKINKELKNKSANLKDVYELQLKLNQLAERELEALAQKEELARSIKQLYQGEYKNSQDNLEYLNKKIEEINTIKSTTTKEGLIEKLEGLNQKAKKETLTSDERKQMAEEIALIENKLKLLGQEYQFLLKKKNEEEYINSINKQIIETQKNLGEIGLSDIELSKRKLDVLMKESTQNKELLDIAKTRLEIAELTYSLTKKTTEIKSPTFYNKSFGKLEENRAKLEYYRKQRDEIEKVQREEASLKKERETIAMELNSSALTKEDLKIKVERLATIDSELDKIKNKEIVEGKINELLKQRDEITKEIFQIARERESIGLKGIPLLERNLEIIKATKVNENDIYEKEQKKYELAKAQYELDVAKLEQLKEYNVELAKAIGQNVLGLDTDFSDAISSFVNLKNPQTAYKGLDGKALEKAKGLDSINVVTAGINASFEMFGKINESAMESERSAIDARIDILETQKQLAKSEEERQKIEKEILIQKQQMVLSEGKYRANQAQNQSIQSGIGSGLSIMAAGMFNPASVVAGALVGVGTAIFGSSKATEERRKAEAEARQLEVQQKIADIVEKSKDYQETSNSYLEDLAKNSKVLGLKSAMDEATSNIIKQAGEIGGASQVGYLHEYWSGGKNSHKKYQQFVKTADIGLEDFGLAKEDLNDYKDIANLNNQLKEKIQKEQQALAKYTIDITTNKEFGEHERANYAQIEANLQAYESMQSQVQSIIDSVNQLATVNSKAYLKATVETLKDEAGDIIGFEADWTEFITKSIEEASKNAIKRTSLGEYFGGVFADGITQALATSIIDDKVQNELEDKMNKVSEAITASIETGLSVNLSDYAKESVDLIDKMNEKQSELNDKTNEFIKSWIEAGGKISDVYTSLGDIGKKMYDSIKSALNFSEYSERYNEIGGKIGESIIDGMKEELINNSLASSLAGITQNITSMIQSGKYNVSDVYSLAQQAQKISAQTYQSANMISSISDLFKAGDMDYVANATEVKYQTSTTSSIINNYNNTIQVDVGNFVGDESSAYEFASYIYPYISDVAKNFGE